MPTVVVTRPLHFEYHPTTMPPSMSNYFSSLSTMSSSSSPPLLTQQCTNMGNLQPAKPRDRAKAQSTDDASFYPLARVSVRSRQSPWDTCVFVQSTESDRLESALETPEDPKSIRLLPRHAYYLEAMLTVPESSLNRHAGMMGLQVELYSDKAPLQSTEQQGQQEQPGAQSETSDQQQKGHSSAASEAPKTASPSPSSLSKTATTQCTVSEPVLIAIARRSARLPHESSWIRTSRQFVCLFFYWIGALKEEKSVYVPLLRHYVESKDYPLVSASQAMGWKKMSSVCEVLRS
jgi:Putative adipose-regulatory protein (Seipin)